MRHIIPLLLACLATVLPATAAVPQADFYVAVGGSDSWSGHLAAPRQGDGPFATFGRAQQAVRQLRQAEPSRPVTVLVRGGTYFLSEPITFTPGDSGSTSAPVTYAAYPGERPVFSGGTRISGWQKGSDGRWEARIPEVASGQWNFSQLFVNGERRFRPRLPKAGYYTIMGTLPASDPAKDRRQDRMRFSTGDIGSGWSNLNDVEVFAFQSWTMARMRIKSVDEAARIVNFTGPAGADAFWSGFPAGNRYLIENVKEALGTPGQWYLDRKTGVLTYIPIRGEKIGKAEVIAPKLDRLVVIKGDVDKHQWVQHLVFRGLSFMHSNWNTPAEGYNGGQAEASIGGAFAADGARYCSLEGCTIARIGTYAAEFGAGCKYNRVDNCELVDLGAGGIKIGEQWARDDVEALTGHNTIYNNRIAHGGRLLPAGIGVWIGQSPYNVVDHNDIYDLYYSGMSIGWVWGYGNSVENHTRIENNHIWEIGQRVLSDMGGTYHLGIAPGTVERHNLIHDVESYSYGGWGIYLDEGSTDVLVQDNVVYRCKTGGFHQHYGENNILRNNIWALAPTEGQLIRTRIEPHLSFTVEHNIIYWKDAPLLGTNWSDDNFKLDYNLYWNAAGRPVSFAGKNFAEWQAKGQDVHSIIADPMFVDPDKGDFRLKPGSPAEKIGFKPIDMTGFGRVGEHAADTGNWPRIYPVPDPAPTQSAAISDDFEYGWPDLPAVGAVVSEENPQATARTTTETAVSGKCSLKFVDMPGQQYSFNPHMYYLPNFTKGTLVGSFALRMESGATFFHEWRDSADPYHIGPTMTISGDGTLSIAGKEVGRIPLSQWVKYEIRCPLGDKAGKYDVTISVPGESSPRRFTGLQVAPGFKQVNWWGFVSNGTSSSVFYLDDVDLRPVGK